MLTNYPKISTLLLTEVQRTKTPLTVTREGKPLVVICPATTQSKGPTFGAMKGSGEILGDLIAPAVPFSTWETLQ